MKNTIVRGVLAGVLFFAFPHVPDAAEADFDPTSIVKITPDSNAVYLQQVTFDLDAGKVEDTDWGQIQVEPFGVKWFSGMRSGYLNVFLFPEESTTQLAWVVENLRIRGGNPCYPAPFPTEPEGLSPAAIGPRMPRSLMSTYFDLRPGIEGNGVVGWVLATVLFSSQPLPPVEGILQMAEAYTPNVFEVLPTIDNAEGDLGEEEEQEATALSGERAVDVAMTVGPPPQPTGPFPDPPADLDFPIEVFQADRPNVDTAKNQCVPMGYANTLQYLEDHYSGSTLLWSIPDEHIPGLGQQLTADDLLLNIWTPVPEDSLVANIDALTMRQLATDLESGRGSIRCQGIRGLFGYLAASGDFAEARFRHQGGEEAYGDGTACDTSIDLGGLVSEREGDNPTWEWIFDHLQKGRAVVMNFHRYDSDGNKTSGHMVRVYGAARYNNKNYLFTLDDAYQGDNSTNVSAPRTQQWEVADTGQPGLGGIPNGRLNMNGTNWEIVFAMYIQAKPTVVIPFEPPI